MIAIEEIRQMPLHEKIAIMEAIWEDLSAQEGAIEVPAFGEGGAPWHRIIITES